VYSKKDRQGMALIAGVIAVVLGILVVRIVIGHQPPPLANNCVGQPTASTVILLDRSDGVSAQTVAEMQARALSFIEDSTQQNELVSIFSISDATERNLTPALSLCRPPSSGNRLYQNDAVIHKHFIEQFETPIHTALSQLGDTASTSPLAEAITDLSDSRYLQAPVNHLLVFSDLMENTSRFSLYHCADTSAVVSAFRAARTGAHERPAFKNTAVALHLIPRLSLSPLDIHCRDRLWLWFFGDNVGSSAGLTFSYLPGGAPVADSPTVRR
jgi:hypothetical protein